MGMDEKKGDRWLRLGDLARHEVIVIRCGCGRNVEYPPGFLQRRYRLASDTLIFDLQSRLRCKGCNRRSGFRITIFDERTRGDGSKPRLERVVVGGGVQVAVPDSGVFVEAQLPSARVPQGGVVVLGDAHLNPSPCAK